jgi:hypothetical protein
VSSTFTFDRTSKSVFRYQIELDSPSNVPFERGEKKTAKNEREREEKWTVFQFFSALASLRNFPPLRAKSFGRSTYFRFGFDQLNHVDFDCSSLLKHLLMRISLDFSLKFHNFPLFDFDFSPQFSIFFASKFVQLKQTTTRDFHEISVNFTTANRFAIKLNN